MPRCRTATPFGRPVEPDVYMTYASASAPTSMPVSGSPDSIVSRATPTTSRSGGAARSVSITQAPALGGVEHRQRGQRARWILGDGGEQSRVVAGHPRDRVGREQIGGVDEA